MIDMRTVILSYIISNAICMSVMALLWLHNRKYFAGLGFWLADFIIQFLALALNATRGILPDFLTMTVSNTLIVGGTALLLVGLEQFTGKRGPHFHNAILLAIFMFVHGWFTLIHPSLTMRTIIFSLGLAFMCFQCAWLSLKRVDIEILPITRGVGIIFAAYCVVSVVRVFQDMAMPVDEDFFKANMYDAAIIMIYQMLFIALTVGLSLMVNRRLVVSLELDLVSRRRAEADLKLSEEKFFKAFHSSPDAILITRARDGQVMEVNEGFSRITGYSAEEALSSSSINLRFWENPEDRDSFLTDLRERQVMRDAKYDFRAKSGRKLHGAISGEIIQLNGEVHILSVVRDITEQHRMEKELRESEKRFRQVAENASEWIWEVDPNGRYTYVSSGVTKVLGYFPEELVDRMYFYDLFDPRNRESLKQEALGVFARQESFKNLTNINLHKDGRRIIFLTSGVPILDARNNLVGYRGVDTDVTEHKQMEEELRNRNNVLATLYQVTLDLINRHDVNDILQSFLMQVSRFLDASDVSFDLLEGGDTLVTYAVTPGQPLQIGDTMRRGEGGWLSWQAVDSGQPAILEDYSAWEKRRKLFESYSIHAVMIIPVAYGGQVVGAINISRREENKPFNEMDIDAARQLAYMVALVMDRAKLHAQLQIELTERKRTEAALLKLAAIEERQRMARDLHDSVNQSIHSLVLFSETLVAMLDRNNVDRARQISERLQESARQALKETRLLLYQTQASVEENDVDFIKELNARLAYVELHAGGKAKVILEGSLNHCPKAWHKDLLWITIEALNNSLKHAQARKVQVIIRCFPKYVELEVSDNGKGFDTTKLNAGGYGLRNMQERAGLLGGTLTCTSTYGKGTSVLFHADIE